MVESGWVTLSGAVNWDYQRQAAIRSIRDLMGVTGISNQILIKPKASAKNIKLDIEDALKRSAHNNATAITVETRGDEVTLTGAVHSWSESRLVTSSAWNSPGVRNVVNHLVVTS